MFDDARWGDDAATVETTNGAIVTMMIRSRWDVVPPQRLRETITPKTIPGIVTTIHEGSSAIATRATVTQASIRGTSSCVTATCHEDVTERSFTASAVLLRLDTRVLTATSEGRRFD